MSRSYKKNPAGDIAITQDNSKKKHKQLVNRSQRRKVNTLISTFSHDILDEILYDDFAVSSDYGPGDGKTWYGYECDDRLLRK